VYTLEDLKKIRETTVSLIFYKAIIYTIMEILYKDMRDIDKRKNESL
jgi:hypothetical protein